ncbi:MAG: hypothetical protein CMM26_08460 [Rhodospirillaceae bacterium]|nr:hypothetical protein [Rhodospirillaceae bacterium]|tara:strand:- start:2840 stop:3565 length:726 start_codon:yes stop_codon:yes gene_type:complete
MIAMNLYEESDFPVRADLEAAHQTQFDRFSQPGTWGSGAQRVAVIAAARQACIDAGVLEAPDNPGVGSNEELPKVVRDIIAKIAVSPKDIDLDFYNAAIGSGLSDAEYTEIVGLVSFICNLDVFARGIGVTPRPLPKPQPGEPSRTRPEEAVQEHAFVPTIPNPPEGGERAKAMYGPFKPYIMRAMSLVPEEFADHIALERAQYLPLEKIMDFDFDHHDGLTRPQAEVIAGRVSALNDCFY